MRAEHFICNKIRKIFEQHVLITACFKTVSDVHRALDRFKTLPFAQLPMSRDPCLRLCPEGLHGGKVHAASCIRNKILGIFTFSAR